MRTACFLLLCIIAGFSSCGDPAHDNVEFLRTNGITEIEKVPSSFESGKGWKELAGDYVYFLNLYNESTDPAMIYLVANKKTKKIIGAYTINDQLIPATPARSLAVDGTSPAIVTNYEEISDADKAKADDMSGFNALLKKIPEMKDFSWKNDLQNRIASGILMKTQFIFVAGTRPDDRLFNADEQPIPQAQLIREILKAEHNVYNRSVERLNEHVEMNQYIAKLDFEAESGSMITGSGKRYINDIFKDDPIDFKGPGKVFFFYPFKSFRRLTERGGTHYYAPAVETFEYTYTPDAEGFPVFSRRTRFASLLNGGK